MHPIQLLRFGDLCGMAETWTACRALALPILQQLALDCGRLPWFVSSARSRI